MQALQNRWRSLPRGVDLEIYGRLVRELRRMGVTTVVEGVY